MRISDPLRLCGVPLALLLAAAACHQAGSNGNAEAVAAAEDRIECRAAGAAAFARDCTVERTTGSDGLVLTVRHPDGHFRRLAVTRDGRGVIAADGAEPARVTVTSSHDIEVTIGGDSYRLPAKVKPPSPAAR